MSHPKLIRQPIKELVLFAVPLITLLSIGYWGAHRDFLADQADQREKLQWLSATAADEVNSLLQQETNDWAWADTTIDSRGVLSGNAWFEIPPLPQQQSEGSRLLAAKLYDDVIQRFPGTLSPGGIPLGPLASYFKLLAAPDTGIALDAAKELNQLALSYPSIITPKLLEQAEASLQERGISDPNAGRWRKQWQPIEQVAGLLNHLRGADASFSQTGPQLFTWQPWMVLRNGTSNGGVVLKVFPLSPWLAKVQNRLTEMSAANGVYFALLSHEKELIPSPQNSTKWPRSSKSSEAGNFNVVVFQDPATNITANRWRILFLGGITLLAGVTLAAAWWRQRKALLLQLDLAQQKDDFIANVSHELRTPVASVKLLSENLASGVVQSPEAAATYYERLIRECQRLTETTEHLLDFSAMEKGQKRFHFQPLNLTQFVAELRNGLEPLAVKRFLSITIKLTEIQPPPLADQEAIWRMIGNLADNAMKFSPPKSEISISIGPAAESRWWQIVVSDQGPGIALKDHERIFERFYRGGKSLNQSTNGTGIGLAVVRHIAEGHGGRVFLSKSSPEGSKFICQLPCSPTNVAQ